MVGWHYQLNGDEFEQTPGNGEGQGSLACCSPWGHKESDTTGRLNNDNDIVIGSSCHNKVLKQKLIISQFWKFKIKVSAVWFLLRFLSLAYRQPSSLRVFTLISLLCVSV